MKTSGLFEGDGAARRDLPVVSFRLVDDGPGHPYVHDRSRLAAAEKQSILGVAA